MRSAAIYARISLDRAGDGAGVARQVEDCEAEAARRGWTVGEVYVDDDISAHSGKRRPAYERMLADIAAGDRDGVMAWHLDRLHRQPKELEPFADVCQAADVKVCTLHGTFDLGTGDGLFVARIMAAVAANESDAKSRRVTRKIEERAAAGLPVGSRRPFGYELDKITVRPGEAAIVAELFGRFLAGESLTSLTRWLNESEVATAGEATEWKTSTVRQMLLNGRYAGHSIHRGEIVAKAVWEPIVTDAVWRRTCAILTDPARRTNRTARRYVLAGLLRCSKCDTVLYGRPHEGTRRYVCKRQGGAGGCGRMSITAGPTEELICEAVLYRLDTPELAAALAGRQAEDLEVAVIVEQIAADEAQLAELAALYADRRVSVTEWMAARNPIEARIKSARRQVQARTNTADVARHLGQGAELRSRWSTLGLDTQRAILRTLLDHVVIAAADPAVRVFNPARVQPVWRNLRRLPQGSGSPGGRPPPAVGPRPEAPQPGRTPADLTP